MKQILRTVLATNVVLISGLHTYAQDTALRRVRTMPAVSGYEQALSREISSQLKALSPKTDNLGNVYVTTGSGAPHRLIVTAMDEPGYVVSDIMTDGYLRVQRLPQASPNPVFDALHFAEPVWIVTRNGKMVNGVFAGLSVHLSPGRLNPPKMTHIEELYVDIGAKSPEEVRAAGVDLLDPISLQRTDFTVGKAGWGGPAIGDRLGCEILLQLAARLKESKAPGTTTIAFVTQQWIGGRGLNRLLTELHPDEMIFVGRVTLAPAASAEKEVRQPQPGTGILLGIAPDAKSGTQDFLTRIKALADKLQIPLQILSVQPPRIAAYTKGASFPESFASLDVPLLWPVTPAETASWHDTQQLQHVLESYLELAPSAESHNETARHPANKEGSTIQRLTEVYGASGHEAAVREEVKSLLPNWAQENATTDTAGNLVLHVGDPSTGDKTPRIAFVAHMDEIGYQIKKIDDDGSLQTDVLGGGYLQYFLGHVALVHTKNGDVGGVLQLPSGWEKPGYEWPSGPRALDEAARVYVGTHTKDETEKLGIAEGDYITIPKQYRPLLGTRANARSFDDRVGCAALIAAVNAIGPNLHGRDATFVWSTEEEVGLKGAAAYAEQAAKEGREPEFVFAVDTFVSADSPLESKRFGDAEIGKGFVVRAVDNSNVVPSEYVDRVVALAKENHIPAQYGVTGGGNDGSVFLRYGTIDVALGWPLRYSHSPGEVIDTKDLDALGKIVEVLARKW